MLIIVCHKPMHIDIHVTETDCIANDTHPGQLGL